MTLPETRYTRSGDVNIAYQVVGDGPIDLLYSGGWITNVELAVPGEVLVSSTVRDLVPGSGLAFEERAAPAQGIPDEWRVFAAV